MEQATSKGKMALYLIGYILLGIFYLVINVLPIPLGGIVGAVRIYKMYKKDATFVWKIRTVFLLIGVLLGSGLLPIKIIIPFALNFGK
ncbi:MAG: hypothetical protein PHW24_04585 [Candidatus Moranbacteria bacterium]|nr:hypothetical protein [Candidatus Moranbacteria bacterium]